MESLDLRLQFPSLRENVALIEATVVTGLEEVAKEECEEKLKTYVTSSMGRIFFQAEVSKMDQVFQLRSVDRIFLILGHTEINFSADDGDCGVKIKELVHQVDWNEGFKILNLVSYLQEIFKSDSFSFRVTCNRTGNHVFDSRLAAGSFGSGIEEKFGWNVNLDDFDVEIILNIVNNLVYVAIQLTKGSLHRRNIQKFGHTTLKPTVAHSLLRLSKIQDSDIVCDPMCGSGSIPIEGSICWPNAKHICGDISEKDIHRTKINFDYVNSKRKTQLPIDIFRWDATRLPINNQKINVVISDLPFGKRVGTKTINSNLYPKVFSEISRVLLPQSGRAVILTSDRNNFHKALEIHEKYLKLHKTLTIRLGGICCMVYILLRNNSRFR